MRAWFAAGRPAMRYAGVGVCNLADFRGMMTNGRWQPAPLRRWRVSLTRRRARLDRRGGGGQRDFENRAVRERGIAAAARSARRGEQQLERGEGVGCVRRDLGQERRGRVGQAARGVLVRSSRGRGA